MGGCFSFSFFLFSFVDVIWGLAGRRVCELLGGLAWSGPYRPFLFRERSKRTEGFDNRRTDGEATGKYILFLFSFFFLDSWGAGNLLHRDI